MAFSPLAPPIQPQPQVKEWIELFDKAVITREELRHQLALATANAISSPTLDDSPAVRAGEGAGLHGEEHRVGMSSAADADGIADGAAP